MKPVSFLGDSLKRLRALSPVARYRVGFQLDKIQRGEWPDDFKPMTAIGKGVEELRIRDESGAYRVVYTARHADAVYVLHVFEKKAQATPLREIEIARKRYAELSKSAASLEHKS